MERGAWSGRSQCRNGAKSEIGLSTAEQGMGRWVMGQMGHENGMGHMGHGSLGDDP